MSESATTTAEPETPVTTSPYAPVESTAHPNRDAATSLLINVVIPLAMLGLAFVAFLLFGKVTAEQRPDLDGSLAGRMQRLPTADVQVVQSLEAVGGQLDLTVDGVVVPFREIQIATEVAGKVVYKDPDCEAGNYVDAGQLLCRIDDSDYQLEVERLSRLREQEYQALKELDQETSNAKRLLDVAKEDLELRTSELRRLESLPAGFASESEIDSMRRARLQAVQVQVNAQNQLDLLLKRRTRLEASERLAAVQLESAKLNLARTEIRSEVSGVIVREDAELNSFVQRGSPIITIEDTSKVEVAVSLRMDQLFWVLDQARHDDADGGLAPPAELTSQQGYELPETDATIRYQVSGRDDVSYQWSGKLLRYDGIGLDQQTRTAPVRIVVENPKRFQKPDGTESLSQGPTALMRGMFVNVSLHIRPRTQLVLIPSLAMQPGNRVWHFYPDPSVLDPPPAESEGEPTAADNSPHLVADEGPETAGESEPTAVEDDDAAPPFHVEDWVAGYVKVIPRVRAIEAAVLDEQQYWICEIVDQTLQPGDLVVTSPLTAVTSDQAVPVRVPAQQTDPGAAAVAVTASR
ncbi:efflux RND transporter periplasmic adaptor subunit [Roseimaritima ulvae]|uniref:Multidrug resistance protein MdtN n=1 Tax=Roseimaritima ulvae TaxID=980254 RepID=A0A5B9QY14_9BACT|nr:HlyD family efflux transporter periplasmic adaptor subunit [Roseimaritima ulvae]QEG38841.1 multidrug resistance protein MdtN [Roseimaritima ulvae]